MTPKPVRGEVWLATFDPVQANEQCEDMRSVTIARLHDRWGIISPDTMELLEDRVRVLLDL